MRYFGGKARIAKKVAEFLNQFTEGKDYYEPFCGALNVTQHIKARRIFASDLKRELISLHQHIQSGGDVPSGVPEDFYQQVKSNPNAPDWLKAFVGFGCSYSGKWWGGYARGGVGRSYASNARNTLLKKMQCLMGARFKCGSYSDCVRPEAPSIIYCDIPYKDSTKYSTGCFDHQEFYLWAEKMQSEGHKVFVSEYSHNVPDGWEVVFQVESKKDIRDKDGIQQPTVEVLMSPKKEVNV